MVAARVHTLPASISPVLAGSALAYAAYSFSPVIALACLALALLLQITANYTNDLCDYQKGADRDDRKGPPTAISANLLTPGQMLAGTLVTLTAASGMVFYLSLTAWPGFLLVGLFCLAGAVLYTAGPYPLGYLGLGDLTVFLFFGPVAVGSTFYLQAGELSPAALIAGGGVGALSSNILLVNNLRDRHEDARCGKNTLTVRLGRSFSVNQYRLLLALAYLFSLLLVPKSTWSFLPLLTVPSGVNLFREIQGKEGAFLNPVLAKSARLLLLYSLLLSIGLIIRQ